MKIYAQITLLGLVLCMGLMEEALGGTIEFHLTAYTNTEGVSVRFDCEGDGLREFDFQQSQLRGVGTVATNQCKLSSELGVVHRDFHLQAIGPNAREFENITYQINTITGSVKGPSLANQSVLFIDSGNPEEPYVMNYGVSHAAPPIHDQAYVYVGRHTIPWMRQIASEFPELTVGQLVLPGSHDSGMYELSDPGEVVEYFCQQIPKMAQLCLAAKEVGVAITAQVVENFSLTQKDTTRNQLLIGARFFDFRPAVSKDGGSAHHIHNFVPGGSFDSFLDDINTFLNEFSDEVVFIQITSSGIDEERFDPLTKEQVESYLSSHISADTVGYTVVNDIRNIATARLVDIAKSKSRVIAIYGKEDVNDSYSERSYAHIKDVVPVLVSIYDTLNRCGSVDYQYNVLQLQATGSEYIVDKWRTLGHETAWINNLFLSGTGSVLQATKPIFDRETYNYLTAASMRESMEGCSTPIILLNDFVDIALVSHAYGLTRHRHNSGSN